MTRNERLHAQGMRCGHIDGKSRVGAYVMGEESAVENLYGDMARYQGLTERTEVFAWTDGYKAGYRIGANGEVLPNLIKQAELP